MKSINWGLGEEWEDVERVLQRILPVYDKTNRIISFGQDLKYRREGLRAVLNRSSLILDAGCGPGNMSKLALEIAGKSSSFVLLDPLTIMLAAASQRLPPARTMPVRGLFEYLPFKNASFNPIITGFAIRDSRTMKTALSEIARVTANNDGGFVSVDLGKPDTNFAQWRVAIFWRIIVPLIALLYLGTKGILYRSLYRTYRKHPRNSELKSYMQTLYEDVETRVKALGAVTILIARKPRHASP